MILAGPGSRARRIEAGLLSAGNDFNGSAHFLLDLVVL